MRCTRGQKMAFNYKGNRQGMHKRLKRGFAFTLEALVSLLILLAFTTMLFINSNYPLNASDYAAAIDALRIATNTAKNPAGGLSVLSDKLEEQRVTTGKCFEAKVNEVTYGKCNFERGKILIRKAFFNGEFSHVEISTG